MKKLLLLTLLALPLLASDCDKESELIKGTVDLNFVGDFGDSPLLMYAREYPYEDGMNVKFQLFQFYISEVTLLKEGNSAEDVEILEVELVSFKDIQDDAAAGTGHFF